MKYFLLFFISFSAVALFAKPTCQDMHLPNHSEHKSQIIYSLMGEQCVNRSSCYNSIQRDVDRCLNQTTALKVFCDHDQPAERKVFCLSGQKCKDGECLDF